MFVKETYARMDAADCPDPLAQFKKFIADYQDGKIRSLVAVSVGKDTDENGDLVVGIVSLGGGSQDDTKLVLRSVLRLVQRTIEDLVKEALPEADPAALTLVSEFGLVDTVEMALRDLVADPAKLRKDSAALL